MTELCFLFDAPSLAVTNALSLLSCSISNFTPKVGEKDTQRAIRQAFNVWQTVTPLSFQVREDHMLKMEFQMKLLCIFLFYFDMM